jgi:hypothetical protein
MTSKNADPPLGTNNKLTAKGASSIIIDVRNIFEHYLEATTASFERAQSSGEGVFLYPQDKIETDCEAFARVFTCLWKALEDERVFATYYAARRSAFDELVTMVTANNYAKYAAFWVQAGERLIQKPPITETDVHSLCRTLRNGFCHFNSRYDDVSPSVYFQKLGLLIPVDIIAPNVADNFRIFICDWKNKRGFMTAGSNTRIIETLLAQLRYHLFRFLARFFSEPGGPAYVDILTQRPMV